MPLTIWKFRSVIKLTMGGNWGVSWPPVIATRYVGFTTTLNTRAQLFKASSSLRGQLVKCFTTL